MRTALVATLLKLAEEDPRPFLLTGDLGFMFLEPFAERFPGRFLNVGVAEQNMVGLATGLAESGFFPYVYSIATFASLRPYEFVRNGPVLHDLPVRIVGVGGGFEYGHAGPTHHGLEDVGVMRAQPGLTVVAPADHAQAAAAIHATWDLPGPLYLRLGKDDLSVVPGLGGRFELGRAHEVRQGRDLVIIAMGAIATEATAAADLLAREGIECCVIVVASVSPAPVDDLVQALARFRLALTVEAHSVVGGVGSLVCEVIAEHDLPCRVVRCGVRRAEPGRGGGQRFLEELHGISRAVLARSAIDALNGGDREVSP